MEKAFDTWLTAACESHVCYKLLKPEATGLPRDRIWSSYTESLEPSIAEWQFPLTEHDRGDAFMLCKSPLAVFTGRSRNVRVFSEVMFFSQAESNGLSAASPASATLTSNI